jgi:hypothetical protein
MTTTSPLYAPRAPIYGGRDSLFAPLADRLLTEDKDFLTTEDGHFINLEVDGQ